MFRPRGIFGDGGGIAKGGIFKPSVFAEGQNAATPVAWTPASPTTDGGVSAEHWYRSDDAYQDAARTTPVASDGDVVGNWTDLTANADHVSQATTGNKPTWQNGVGDQLNGHPVILFDGIDDYLRGAFTTGGALSQPFTVFIVAKLDALAVNDGSNRFVFDGDDGVNRALGGTNATPNPDTWRISAGASVNGSASDSNWNMWLCLFNGASSQFWHNGISEASGNAGGNVIDGLTMGNGATGGVPWLGPVIECVIYDSNLSNADKNEVGNYLATRYGLSWTAI